MSKSRSTRVFGGTSRRGQTVELQVHPHRSYLVQIPLAVSRWSTEIVVVILLVAVYGTLADDMPGYAALAVIAVPVTTALAIPQTRRLVSGWFWCTVIRHRLRTFFVAVHLHNHVGKLPWQLVTYPTPIGVRTWLFLVAGQSVDDIANATNALAATCWAQEARVERARRYAHLVRVDVIRRDPLANPVPLRSRLLGKHTHTNTGPLAAPVGNPIAAPTLTVVDPTGTAGPTTPAGAAGLPSSPWGRPGSAAEDTHPTRPARNGRRTDPPAPTVMVGGEDLSDYV